MDFTCTPGLAFALEGETLECFFACRIHIIRALMKKGSQDYITGALTVFSYERLVLHRPGDKWELSVLGRVGMLHFTIPLAVAE